MPARDLYHDVVRSALIKAGWMITHDPLVLKVGPRIFSFTSGQNDYSLLKRKVRR